MTTRSPLPRSRRFSRPTIAENLNRHGAACATAPASRAKGAPMRNALFSIAVAMATMFVVMLWASLRLVHW
jgi:hypothetical protein